MSEVCWVFSEFCSQSNRTYWSSRRLNSCAHSFKLCVKNVPKILSRCDNSICELLQTPTNLCTQRWLQHVHTHTQKTKAKDAHSDFDKKNFMNISRTHTHMFTYLSAHKHSCASSLAKRRRRSGSKTQRFLWSLTTCEARNRRAVFQGFLISGSWACGIQLVD